MRYKKFDWSKEEENTRLPFGNKIGDLAQLQFVDLLGNVEDERLVKVEKQFAVLRKRRNPDERPNRLGELVVQPAYRRKRHSERRNMGETVRQPQVGIGVKKCLDAAGARQTRGEEAARSVSECCCEGEAW